MTSSKNPTDQLCVNTLRFLAVDAVEQAQSGHPGLPLGVAPMAYVLWDRFLRYNPHKPYWPDRDRFILSAGHGSALLYALLHAYGYDVTLDDLKHFRQWGSKTPGHPEYGHTQGVDATTGPLGQGFAMGVGMALSERFTARCFNRDDMSVIDHFTYAIVSDGDLMEGVASEAASLAGALNLGKLIYLYDDNHISIEGDTDIAFTENVRQRFEAYGWHVLKVSDGNDLELIDTAIREAQLETTRPTLISVRTHIGFGSPKQDTPAAHGSPLGPDALRKTKANLGWPETPSFFIPNVALDHLREATRRSSIKEAAWHGKMGAYRRAHPDLAAHFDQELRHRRSPKWDVTLPHFLPEDGPIATRKASGKVLNALSEQIPMLAGGSADLGPSTNTQLFGYGDFGFGDDCSRNIHFGVREHAMGAMANGMALHGGVLPYTATFLAFSDYMRPALRMAALMQTHAIFIFTHDSIAMGEDGPTHQPVEHLMSLRAIPGLIVLRPADANETVEAWRLAANSDGPVVLILTRQKLPILDAPHAVVEAGVAQGGYILSEAPIGIPEVILIGTGSEVSLAISAQATLHERGVQSRVVSMPSWERWNDQPESFRNQVLPREVPKLAIEAGITQGWRDIVGDTGDVIGLNQFGASAPGKLVYEKFGFTVDHVVERAVLLVENRPAEIPG